MDKWVLQAPHLHSGYGSGSESGHTTTSRSWLVLVGCASATAPTWPRNERQRVTRHTRMRCSSGHTGRPGPLHSRTKIRCTVPQYHIGHASLLSCKVMCVLPAKGVTESKPIVGSSI
eukprot:scaffold3368_cov107-Isochrysis_galbana.AAC.5